MDAQSKGVRERLHRSRSHRSGTDDHSGSPGSRWGGPAKLYEGSTQAQAPSARRDGVGCPGVSARSPVDPSHYASKENHHNQGPNKLTYWSSGRKVVCVDTPSLGVLSTTLCTV